MASKVELISGIERNREHPNTFWIPSPEDKAKLVDGDYVKLMFLNPNREQDGVESERMWVRIMERAGDNFVGQLANDPAVIKKSLFGRGKIKIINFTADHIINILN